MRIEAVDVADYMSKVPGERKTAMANLRKTILDNIPDGFEETMNYGMVGYVVPHKIYPVGYHCDPKLPLPFTNIASQKNFIAFYHSGIYANPTISDWFVNEYPKHCKYNLDMGKSCVRFKKIEDIPFDLIGKLMQKITVDDWINTYENNIKR